MFLILLISYIHCIYCAKTNSNKKHSDIYNNYKNNEFPISDFYMKNTFGGNLLSIDKCKPYTTRKEFINTLNRLNIKCSGKWCNCDGTYKYISLYKSYEIEHIIDLKNSELNNCNKNIYGNIVLTYGLWNRQVGNLNWNNAKKEKSEIYGNIVNKALLNIIDCDPECENNNNIDNHIEYKYIYYCIGILSFVVMLIFMLIFIIGIITYLIIKKYDDKSEIKYDSLIDLDLIENEDIDS